MNEIYNIIIPVVIIEFHRLKSLLTAFLSECELQMLRDKVVFVSAGLECESRCAMIMQQITDAKQQNWQQNSTQYSLGFGLGSNSYA